MRIMDIHKGIAQLRRSGITIDEMVRGVTADDARWKPAEDRWSILEVVNHLADEEAEDFRTRLEITLGDPEAPWPKLDPEGIVSTRSYNTRDLGESIGRFRIERERSLAWLAGLDASRLDNAHAHPSFGPLRAGDLLVSWIAHDLLHIRQIARLQYEIVARDGAPYVTDYAGPLR
jgi:hypothetical protein